MALQLCNNPQITGIILISEITELLDSACSHPDSSHTTSICERWLVDGDYMQTGERTNMNVHHILTVAPLRKQYLC